MAAYLKKVPPKPPQDASNVEQTVRRMLDDIGANRDAAVRKYARDLDKWEGESFRVTPDEIRAVSARLPESFKQDFEYCRKQVMGFAERQKESLQAFETETESGITLGQKVIPVSRVGCYVPGGKYPLISSAIMSVGTAKVAGVDYIIACTPPRW
jgi:sulfopropanediol 3-dehydrogenase